MWLNIELHQLISKSWELKFDFNLISYLIAHPCRSQCSGCAKTNDPVVAVRCNPTKSCIWKTIARSCV